ncbi:MAG: hypothetical protein ACPGJS_09125 [Flammeovirgaceae bacterium]
MKHILPLLIVSVILLACQTPKEEAETRIKQWYNKQAQGYSLVVQGTEAIATITRYHPERPTEKNDLIRITWKGMSITLAFKKPIQEIEWTESALEQNLSYYVVDDIYHNIDLKGWEVHPQTPQSSTSVGLEFTTVAEGKLAFSIDWETYAVFGYSQSAACQEQLEIADASLPEACYINVEQRIPLHIDVDVSLTK